MSNMSGQFEDFLFKQSLEENKYYEKAFKRIKRG